MSESGILCDSQIKGLLQGNAISITEPLAPNQVQPASMDLRLGTKAHRVRASFLPGQSHLVAAGLKRWTLHEIDISEGAVLETGCVYIVPLMESLALPDGMAATTNPKSSTGRLDVFTRVITDHAQEFDKISEGYHGPLYLEISPRTFPIVVRSGSRLSQIRFRTGQPTLSMDALKQEQETKTLISDANANISANGVAVSIDLIGDDDGLIGYRGKRHSSVVDVDRVGAYNRFDYWEPIHQRGHQHIILDPDEFYILVSQEAVHVPGHLAAEMVPFDPLVGEFRVHYAGFFDPGFGSEKAGGLGSRAVLEVRSHEVPFILEHGQIVGRLIYEQMLQLPETLYGADLKSNYQAQGLKLSKHFI